VSAAQRGALAICWTVGDVSDHGFEALRLSVLGARRMFGPDAACVTCVNSIPLEQVRARSGPPLRSELDEQGLQTAALSRTPGFRIVSVEDVAICSPFPPHLPHLGRCGAHFVGLNAKSMPWSLAGRPAVQHLAEHWRRHRPAICRRVGLAPPESQPP
jgi:hypothetical protein